MKRACSTVGNGKEGVGKGGKTRRVSRIFNFLSEFRKQKQSWESMRTSIVPAPVNQITAGRGDDEGRSRRQKIGKKTGSEVEIR